MIIFDFNLEDKLKISKTSSDFMETKKLFILLIFWVNTILIMGSMCHYTGTSRKLSFLIIFDNARLDK